MNKEAWIEEAKLYMIKRTGDWEPENLHNICDSLYETYVEEDSESEWTPESAVDEELTYWTE